MWFLRKPRRDIISFPLHFFIPTSDFTLFIPISDFTFFFSDFRLHLFIPTSHFFSFLIFFKFKIIGPWDSSCQFGYDMQWQGQTLPQLVVDLAKAERAAVLQDVVLLLFPVRFLQNIALQPMAFQRQKQTITGKDQRRRTVKKSSSNHRTLIPATCLIRSSIAE